MPPPPDASARAFGAALVALHEELDWPLLERLYCWDEGDGFFGADAREALIEAGLLVASGLAEQLAALPAAGPARSLYVGAAVAELAPMLCEALVLGREVRVVNLPGPEADELNRALAAVGVPLAIETDPVDAPVDHLWVVSVLTDPEAFPALHDALYERSGDDAVGGGDEATERARAAELVTRWTAGLRAPAVLSTTDEELPFFRAEAAARGARLDVPRAARLSPIVGDAIRHCAWR